MFCPGLMASPEACFQITVFKPLKWWHTLRYFLKASGNVHQNFLSWMPETAHLNNICKGHENGRCLKLGHVYLCVEHGFRHLASYMKITQVWIAHFQTSVVMLVIILFAHMQKHAKCGCRQQELIQHGCASRGGQDFLHHQVSKVASNNSRGVECTTWGCTCMGICHGAGMGRRWCGIWEKDIQRCRDRKGGREGERITLKIKFKVVRV